MFGKKKEKVPVDVSDAKDLDIPVYYGSQQIGEVIHVKAKEIGGLDHLEIWLKLAFGSGFEVQLRDVLTTQGLYIGRPPEWLIEDTTQKEIVLSSLVQANIKNFEEKYLNEKMSTVQHWMGRWGSPLS